MKREGRYIPHFAISHWLENRNPNPTPYIILFFSCLAIRWTFYRLWGPTYFPDSLGRYLPIADHLFQEWRGTAYDPPGYPLFLAFLRKTAIPGLEIGIQGILDSLTIVLGTHLAGLAGLGRGKWVMSAFFAIHMGSVVFASSYLSETLFQTLVISSVWLFFRGQHSDKAAWWISAGIAASLASLTRGNGLLVAASLSLCLVFSPSFKAVLRRLALFGLPILLLSGSWIGFNYAKNNLLGIAQGGGFQWLQNMAYFGLVEPDTIPQEYQHLFGSWESLSEIRAQMLHSGTAPASVDPVFKAIAIENVQRHPWRYCFSTFAALRLPRRFIKDMTRTPLSPEAFEEQSQKAHSAGYLDSPRKPPQQALFLIPYRIFRILTILPGKYTILFLFTFLSLLQGLVRKNLFQTGIALVPFLQILSLQLMLNPIERYYFPFEILMVLSFSLFMKKIKHGTMP